MPCHSVALSDADTIAQNIGEIVEVLARFERVWRGAAQSHREAIAALAGCENAELGDVATGIATGWERWSADRWAALDALLQNNVGD